MSDAPVFCTPSWVVWSVGALALLVFTLCLAPGLTWAFDGTDGGELAVAAYTLGVAHPPGYPTYLLLAHSWTYLPFGELATRTNWFSACCAAGAVMALAAALADGPWFATWSAALLLAFTPLLWSQAVITEVYALNALGVALTLALACRAKQPAHWALLGWVWGLSLGNHPSAWTAWPLILWAAGRVRQMRHGIGALLGGIVLGGMVYLYVPLRAGANPPVNWGDPRTLERFGWLVSGSLYHSFLFALPLRFWGVRLLTAWGLFVRHFLGVGALLSLIGGWRLRHSGLGWAIGGMIASSVALAVGYDTTDSYLYLLPAWVGLAFWAGYGFRQIAQQLQDRPMATKGLALGALVLPMLALGGRFSQMDLGPDAQVDAFRRRVWFVAPPRAWIWSASDAWTFTAWYEQWGRGTRTDLVVADLDLWNQSWYRAMLSRQVGQDVPMPQTRPNDAAWSRLLGRPVCRIQNEPLTLSCISEEES